MFNLKAIPAIMRKRPAAIVANTGIIN